MYEFQLHFTQIILIAFYAAGLLTALVVTLLSCLFARRRGDHARTGIPWFKAAAVLSSVWFIFAIATVLVQYFRFASLGYDKSLILAGYHVPLISTLVYDATQATILMTNLELVLGLRHIVTAGYQGHGALPRASLPRIFGLVIFAVVMVKSIGRFAANEVLVMGGYYVDGYEHAARAGLILSFLIYLALFLSAIFVLIHAGRTPRVFETRQIHTFLIVMSSLALLHALFEVLISGIYDIGTLAGAYVNTPTYVIIIAVVLRAGTMTAGLIVGCIAVTKKHGGLWTHQAVQPEVASYGYVQQGHVQQGYVQQGYVQQ